MAWIEPQYDKQTVNRAGRDLVTAMRADLGTWTADDWDAYEHAFKVVNNWRSSHAYPLNTFQVNLRATVRRFDRDPLVAQRIKRFQSIGHKLDRFPTMKLSQMQDLGGCRAILSNALLVHEVSAYYLRSSSIKHARVSFDDYISRPKASGYRGQHIVYRYFSDKNKTQYNGLKIEIQLRSRYQHAWATAVETVGMFSGEALKSSLGSGEWQHFFALMASAIALREKSPPVPGVPTDRRSLIEELSDLARSLSVERRLREYGRAMKTIQSDKGMTGAHFYLLQLDVQSSTLAVKSFKANESDIAEIEYSQAESLQASSLYRDTVLVSVDSINALSRAYPNYFADTRVFIELLSQAVSGRSRSISA